MGEEKLLEHQWYSFLYQHILMCISSLINNKLVTNTVKKTVIEFKVISKQFLPICIIKMIK